MKKNLVYRIKSYCIQEIFYLYIQIIAQFKKLTAQMAHLVFAETQANVQKNP